MKIRNYIKDPHTAIFTSTTAYATSRLVLDLIKKEYNKYHDYIIIICRNYYLRRNKTYHTKGWIKHNGNVLVIQPKEKLYQ